MTAAKNSPAQNLKIPDVAGLTLKQAALAYAEAGLHIVPTSKWDIKNPGSVVIEDWPKKATCDFAQVEKWWNSSRVGGIAFHPGPSGAVVFDLDEDCDDRPESMPGEIWAALRTGAIHRTRKPGVGKDARAHYMFACGPGEFGCGAGGFKRWGQIRSQGGGVVLAPTPHPDADTKDGEYHWATVGELPPLPDLLREMLSAPGEEAPPKTSNELKIFLAEHADADSGRPNLLNGQLKKIKKNVEEGASRHDSMVDALPWAFREAIAGYYPAQRAYEELRKIFFDIKPEAEFTGEFDRIATWAAAQAELANVEETRARVERPKEQPDATTEPIFRTLDAHALATLDAPTEFLIKRVLKTDTFGVNGGPKKSLKTHDNLAIGLAVATGVNLYNDDRFEVPEPQKVLYIVGEGGEHQIARIFQRMLAAYGIKREDIDSSFPFVSAFGAAPLDSPKLRDEINRLLDDHQPTLVLMESFYNFHPVAVTASNLYERGQLIDQYHKLVRAGGSGVTSLLTDHTKKSATGLDLDEISMSGQAENADSWIMRGHRFAASVQTGDFWLTTSFNGRDWGGNTYDVDWHLGPFNHDKNAHDGTISWDVHDHGAAGTTSAPTVSTLRTDVLALVNANPWRENRSSLVTKLKKNRQMVISEITTMLVDKLIEEDTPKNRGASGKAPVFGPGPTMTAAMSKFLAPRWP